MGWGGKGDGRCFVPHKLVMKMKCKFKSGIGANFRAETNTVGGASTLLSRLYIWMCSKAFVIKGRALGRG